MDRLARQLQTIAAGDSTGDVIQDALVAIRNHLGMDVAYFSEFADGRAIFRKVDAPGLEHLIKPGDSQSLEDIYCNHILEGRLPQLMPDTSLEPQAAGMPITGALPIGSHVSMPIRLRDGSAFGMFCCLSSRPNPSLNARDLATMKVFADLAAKQVNAELEERLAERQRRSRIEAVLDQGGFEIVFQPIHDLGRLDLVGYEALSRFASQPYRSPDQWFAEAWDGGLGIELELKVIAAAVASFERLPPHLTLSVNTSPATVISGRLPQALAIRHLDRTIVEITEHAEVSDYAELHRQLAPLKRLGVKVAVDDAGAGYSGLQHLVQMEPDIIKMDMSLTRGIDENAARRAMASAMVHYARETGSQMLAEGIETQEELLTLQALGIARGQGYLLGRPGRLPVHSARRLA